MQSYVTIGCNCASATPEEVGRAQLAAGSVADLLPRISERLGLRELVYLATCHRTEWYAVHDGGQCPGQLLLGLSSVLPELTGGLTTMPNLASCFAVNDKVAVRHLFRVTCALESIMVGDNQILGQVKDAFRRAHDLRLTGPLTTALFTQAFRAAKRVRSETALSRGAVSLLSLAERCLRARLDADGGAVAVVGAGEMAALAAELVRSLDAGRSLVVFNRGRQRGEALAARFGAAFEPLGALGNNGHRFAAVIAGASAAEPLIGPELAARLAPTLLLDLGMPPAVAGACDGVAGIQRVDQRVLRREAEHNRSARSGEIGKAEEIIEAQLRELAYELMEVDLSPVARRLLDAFREVVRKELERASGGDHGEGPAQLEATVERLTQRLVRVPLRGLREVAWQHTPEVLTTFLEAVQS